MSGNGAQPIGCKMATSSDFIEWERNIVREVERLGLENAWNRVTANTPLYKCFWPPKSSPTLNFTARNFNENLGSYKHRFWPPKSVSIAGPSFYVFAKKPVKNAVFCRFYDFRIFITIEQVSSMLCLVFRRPPCSKQPFGSI